MNDRIDATPIAPFWRRWMKKASEDSDALRPDDTPRDRGAIASTRSGSITARINRWLGFGLAGILGASFLTWYYARAFKAPSVAQQQVSAQAQAKASGEMTLPPLGAVNPPNLSVPSSTPSVDGPPTGRPRFVIGNVLGDDASSTDDTLDPDAAAILAATPRSGSAPPSAVSAPTGKSPAQLALERQLSASVFNRSKGAQTPEATRTEPTVLDTALTMPTPEPTILAAGAESSTVSSAPSAVSVMLRSDTTPAVTAKVLPTQRLLLPKGSFIDCTLETAIDSTLPGLTTCITALDTFSSDGTVVLMERGTKLIGETRGEVGQGASRIFVLWTEARTPTGIVIPLASPGTDELGRSGLPGQVNHHFFERFGAAILISMIDGAIQAEVARQGRGSDGTTVVYNPTQSRDLITEVLKSTIGIPPTLTKRNGDRIQVLVARDVDFRSVYALRAQ